MTKRKNSVYTYGMKKPVRLNAAIVMSASIHCMALIPLSQAINMFIPYAEQAPLSVDYYVVEEYINKTLAESEPPTLDVSKVEETEPAIAKQVTEVIKEPEIQAQAAEQEKPVIEEHDINEISRLKRIQEQIRSLERKAREEKYFNEYFIRVRDTIKGQLKKNYSDFIDEGDVYLEFTLSSDGGMLSYRVDRAKSTSATLLLDVAELSLVESAPFPPFPKDLSQKRITFNVTVSFKK